MTENVDQADLLLELPFHHFSVDDVFSSLVEVSDRKQDLFEHPLFNSGLREIEWVVFGTLGVNPGLDLATV